MFVVICVSFGENCGRRCRVRSERVSDTINSLRLSRNVHHFADDILNTLYFLIIMFYLNAFIRSDDCASAIMTSMPMGIVISCIRPSIRPSMGLSLGIADKSLGRNGLHFGTLMYPYDLPLVYRRLLGLLSFSSFVRPFGFGFDLGWGMVVIITEGNRWYLLPLLTAHPGCFTPMSWRNVLSHWLRPCSITHK